MLVMVITNSSGDRVGLSHWEESFREHCRDDVYVCSRCKSSYVRSTSKGKKLDCPWRDVPVISPSFTSV